MQAGTKGDKSRSSLRIGERHTSGIGRRKAEIAKAILPIDFCSHRRARAGHRRTTRIFKPVKNEEVVQRVNKILVGWGNYFQCGYPRKANI